MKEVPGYPRQQRDPRREPVRSESPAPISVQSAPPIVVQGAGWKATIPAVLITALASSIGARMLPTPSSADSGIAELRQAQQIRDLRDEQFRAEVRTELRAIREKVERSDDESRNRYAELKARFEAR